ncbi:MAG TPA: hypothetical protein VGB16_02955, partial [candidate division Zixibacteria bacterium]
MKRGFWVLALLMISCLAGCGGLGDKLEDKTVLAKVGDRILTAEDMETEIPEEYKSSVTLEQ